MLPLGISAAQLPEQGVNCGWIEGVNQPQLILLVSGISNPILIEGGSDF